MFMRIWQLSLRCERSRIAHNTISVQTYRQHILGFAWLVSACRWRLPRSHLGTHAWSTVINTVAAFRIHTSCQTRTIEGACSSESLQLQRLWFRACEYQAVWKALQITDRFQPQSCSKLRAWKLSCKSLYRDISQMQSLFKDPCRSHDKSSTGTEKFPRDSQHCGLLPSSLSNWDEYYISI